MTTKARIREMVQDQLLLKEFRTFQNDLEYMWQKVYAFLDDFTRKNYSPHLEKAVDAVKKEMARQTQL
jgi:hypothetical protein